MSLEQRLEDLTKAINELPAKLAGLLNSTAPAASAKEGTSSSSEKQPEVDSTNTTNEKADSDGSTENVAGRKTYVWDKKTHTGQIIEKGEVVPTGDNLVNLGKSKWDAACEKYGLDPATGQPVEKEEEPAEEELPEEEELPSGDDDLGLDDPEEEASDEISYDEAKKTLVGVMRIPDGREKALKLMKKYGASNFDQVKSSDYAAICKDAKALIAKAG